MLNFGLKFDFGKDEINAVANFFLSKMFLLIHILIEMQYMAFIWLF